MDLTAYIRAVPDFPKPGILFRDVSPLLAHPAAWEHAVVALETALTPFAPDLFVGIESRGFLVAAPLALQMGVGFVMARKAGKLPGAVESHAYALEYGTDTLQVQAGAVRRGARVIVLDDLLATGGTMLAAIHLLRAVGAEVVAAACLIELSALGGRAKLDVPFVSLIAYDD